MNPAKEKLYEAVALELAEKRMKPGLYAKAFADAAGDKDKALAFYIKLRFEDMCQEIEAAQRAAEAAVHAAAEKAAAEAAALNFKDPMCQCSHRSSQHSDKGFWRYPCFQCGCKDFCRA